MFIKKICSLAILLVGLSAGCFSSEQSRSDEKEPLSAEDLKHWDGVAAQMLLHHPLENGGHNRFFGYYYLAQKQSVDGAEGMSVGPVSVSVLRLFFRGVKRAKLSDEKLRILEEKIGERLRREQAGMHPVSLPSFEGAWRGKKPYYGIQVPTMEPWALPAANAFRPPAPPPAEDPFWQEELAAVRQEMEEATEEERALILYWDHEADWKQIGDDYMEKMGTPVAKRVEVRAKIACALFDAFVAIWDAKYAYLVRRPNQLDPQLKTVVPTPNHPSYPCGHCGMAAAAVGVLTHYFPENGGEWQRMLEEVGRSRVQSGLHFPIDVEAAKQLGNQVGRTSIAKDPFF